MKLYRIVYVYIYSHSWTTGVKYPVGIEWVLVNGGVEVENENFLGKGYGRALRRGE